MEKRNKKKKEDIKIREYILLALLCAGVFVGVYFVSDYSLSVLDVTQTLTDIYGKPLNSNTNPGADFILRYENSPYYVVFYDSQASTAQRYSSTQVPYAVVLGCLREGLLFPTNTWTAYVVPEVQKADYKTAYVWKQVLEGGPSREYKVTLSGWAAGEEIVIMSKEYNYYANVVGKKILASSTTGCSPACMPGWYCDSATWTCKSDPNPPPPIENVAPVINEMTATGFVKGGTGTVTVKIYDPDSASVTAVYSAYLGNTAKVLASKTVSLSNKAATFTWEVPNLAVGDYALRTEIRDGVLSAESTLNQLVTDTFTGITVSGISLTPVQPLEGKTTNIKAYITAPSGAKARVVIYYYAGGQLAQETATAQTSISGGVASFDVKFAKAQEYLIKIIVDYESTSQEWATTTIVTKSPEEGAPTILSTATNPTILYGEGLVTITVRASQDATKLDIKLTKGETEVATHSVAMVNGVASWTTPKLTEGSYIFNLTVSNLTKSTQSKHYYLVWPSCNPPCSTGYYCDNGTCKPNTVTCTPPCSTGYYCDNGTCKPNTVGNEPPEITSLTLESEVKVGESAKIVVKASDPEGETMTLNLKITDSMKQDTVITDTYTWTTSKFTNGGDYTCYATVSDGEKEATASVKFNVKSSGGGGLNNNAILIGVLAVGLILFLSTKKKQS